MTLERGVTELGAAKLGIAESKIVGLDILESKVGVEEAIGWKIVGVGTS